MSITQVSTTIHLARQPRLTGWLSPTCIFVKSRLLQLTFQPRFSLRSIRWKGSGRPSTCRGLTRCASNRAFETQASGGGTQDVVVVVVVIGVIIVIGVFEVMVVAVAVVCVVVFTLNRAVHNTPKQYAR